MQSTPINTNAPHDNSEMTVEAAAEFFKLLSDPLRLRILHLLQDGELCVCDLVSILKANQSTVSRHLSQLRRAQLLQSRREGVWIHYAIRQGLPDWKQTALRAVSAMAANNPELKRDTRLRQQWLKNKTTPVCPDAIKE